MIFQTFGELFQDALTDPRFHFIEKPVQMRQFIDLIGIPMEAASGAILDKFGLLTPRAKHEIIMTQEES